MLKTQRQKKQTFARTVGTMKEHFRNIDDPRTRQDIVQHLLIDIIIISICGIIAGAEGPTGIEKWAKLNEKQLKKYLKLPNGIPSHDRINVILQTINPKQFQEAFANWMQTVVVGSTTLSEDTDDVQKFPDQVAIDGKKRRRSRSPKRGLGALDVVTAWNTEHGISLGQTVAESKSNEIKAIPELLRLIDFDGCVITIDAAGTQKNIARQIILGNGDYVLGLKGNQGTMHKSVKAYFSQIDLTDSSVSYCDKKEKGHGREEHREYWTVSVPKDFEGAEKWLGLKTFGMVRRTWTEGDGKVRSDTRYFLCSIKRDARYLEKYVRGHWGIENSLHWVLDMTFREDESQARNRRLGENLSWLNRVALSLLRQHPSKTSIKLKQKSCAWDFDFLMQVLTGQWI